MSSKETEAINDNIKYGSSFEDRIKKIPAIGILLSMISAVFFATSTLIVKLLENINSLAIFSHRSLVQLIVYSTILIITKQNPLKNHGEYLHIIKRSLYGFFCITASYQALRLLPLGDASAIIFASPAFASIFAYVSLNEEFGLRQIITLILVFCGSIFIAKPTVLFDSERDLSKLVNTHLQGCCFATIGCIFHALLMVTLRRIERTSPSVIIFWYSVISIILGFTIIFCFKLNYLPNSTNEVILLISIGFCGVFGQYFITSALKLEDAGPVSIASSFDVFISFVYQVLITRESIEWNSILGSILIVSGIVCVVLNKFNCNKYMFKNLIITKRRNTANNTKVNTLSESITSEPENI